MELSCGGVAGAIPIETTAPGGAIIPSADGTFLSTGSAGTDPERLWRWFECGACPCDSYLRWLYERCRLSGPDRRRLPFAAANRETAEPDSLTDRVCRQENNCEAACTSLGQTSESTSRNRAHKKLVRGRLRSLLRQRAVVRSPVVLVWRRQSGGRGTGGWACGIAGWQFHPYSNTTFLSSGATARFLTP
jgi:hypothetical protein